MNRRLSGVPTVQFSNCAFTIRTASAGSVPSSTAKHASANPVRPRPLERQFRLAHPRNAARPEKGWSRTSSVHEANRICASAPIPRATHMPADRPRKGTARTRVTVRQAFRGSAREHGPDDRWAARRRHPSPDQANDPQPRRIPARSLETDIISIIGTTEAPDRAALRPIGMRSGRRHD
jgi:hypothetical protein